MKTEIVLKKIPLFEKVAFELNKKRQDETFKNLKA